MGRSSSKSDALGRQSAIVFAGLGVTIVLGIAVQSFLAARLGTSKLADVFYLGTAVPTLIATATLGSSANALVRYATDSPGVLDPFRRRSAGQSLLLLSAALSVAVALAGVLLLIGAFSYGSREVSKELGSFILITAPVPLLIAVTALASVLALADQEFLRATWGGAANGLGLLIAIVVFAQSGLNATKMALAVVIGYVVQLAFVSPALRIAAEDREARSREVAKAATVGVLVLLGASAIYKSQPLVERLVGAMVDFGVPAALGYTDKITSALTQTAAFGFSLAALPAMSRDLAARDHGAAAAKLRVTLIGTLTSTMVVVAFGLSSSQDIVEVLYGRGEFSEESIELTHTLMLYALPSVVLGALAGPLVAIGYANKQIRAVVRIGLAGFVFGTAMTVLLASLIGAEGVVLGTGCGFALTLVMFARLSSHFLPGWQWSKFVGSQAPYVAMLAVVLAAAAFIALVVPIGDSTLVSLLGLGVRFAIFAAFGFGLLFLVGRLRPPSQGPADEAEATADTPPSEDAPEWVSLVVDASDPTADVELRAGRRVVAIGVGIPVFAVLRLGRTAKSGARHAATSAGHAGA